MRLFGAHAHIYDQKNEIKLNFCLFIVITFVSRWLQHDNFGYMAFVYVHIFFGLAVIAFQPIQTITNEYHRDKKPNKFLLLLDILQICNTLGMSAKQKTRKKIIIEGLFMFV